MYFRSLQPGNLKLLKILKIIFDRFIPIKDTNHQCKTSSTLNHLPSDAINSINSQNETPALPVPSSQLHQPLLTALKLYPSTFLTVGTILFHGSREHSPETDYSGRSLTGTRKWFSQDAAYAVGYAFYGSNKPELGQRLLWKCRVIAPIPSLIGSQFALFKQSGQDSSFPWKFPSLFGAYANEIFQNSGPSALLDHPRDEIYKEILIASHRKVVEIIEVIVLPEDRDTADKIAAEIMNSTLP